MTEPNEPPRVSVEVLWQFNPPVVVFKSETEPC